MESTVEPDLDALLASSDPYPKKVGALIAARDAGCPGLATLVRRHIPAETDPFVLATLASVLGRCGEPRDADLLMTLLVEEDHRVVASALEALHRLQVDVPISTLGPLLDRIDPRVRTSALAILATTEPDRAMDLMSPMADSPEPGRRTGIAYLLGDLSQHARATDLLVSMLALETNGTVLEQLAQSLKKHASPRRARLLVGPLHVLRERATGARRSVLSTLLYELSVEHGLVEAEVARLGEEAWKAVQPPAAPIDAGAPEAHPVPSPPEAVAEPVAEAVAEPVAEPVAEAVADEADPPLSFSHAYPAGPPSRKITKPSVPIRPRARSWGGSAWLAGAGLATAVLIAALWAMPTQPGQAEEPGAPAAPRGRRPASRSRAAASIHAQIRARGGSVSGGAPVDLEGKVVGVSGSHAVLECKGRYYLLVRGDGPTGSRTGETIHVNGTLLGASEDGLIHVQCGAR